MPEIMPGAALGVVAAEVVGMGIAVWFERLPPVSVGILAPEKAGGSVEEIAVVAAAFLEKCSVFLLAKRLGQLRRAPVVISGFQRT